MDECAEGSENKCDDNAECVNEVGSYYCKCKAGYEGNGVTCEGQCQIHPIFSFFSLLIIDLLFLSVNERSEENYKGRFDFLFFFQGKVQIFVHV